MDELTDVAGARNLAATHIEGMSGRWSHVQAVGRKAESLSTQGPVIGSVVRAAWLHDIGYAPGIAMTGLHPLDGAVFLEAVGESDTVVSLVAYHSGAVFEAEERGLLTELQRFPKPPDDLLDVVTLFDMTTSPTGEPVKR